MSTKAADEPECKSVAEAQLAESSASLETSTIKVSDEFQQIFELLCAISKNTKSFNKKQIRAVQTKMDKLYDKVTNFGDATLDDIVILGYSYQTLFILYFYSDKKEEQNIAKDYILRCLNLIRDKELDPKSILLALNSRLQLGYVYYKQKRLQKALQIQERAIELYLTYTREEEEYGSPIDFEDIINKLPAKLDGYVKLKTIYKIILDLVLNIHDFIVPINNQSLMAYKHLYLEAEFGDLSENRKYFHWILKAIELCDQLIKCSRFAEARRHLTLAMLVHNMAHSDEKYDRDKEEFSSKSLPNLQEKSIVFIFNVYWVKYGLSFLRYSAERLLRLETDEDSATNLKPEYPTKSKEHISEKLLLFDRIEKGEPTLNKTLTVKRIIDYSDIHRLFVYILTQLHARKFLFDPDKNVDTYMQIILDLNSLYKCMALYEKNTVNRISLQNQQVYLLSETIKNKKCLRYPKVLRRLQFQLAIGYTTLIDAQLENLDAIPSIISEKRDEILFEIKHLLANALMNLRLYVILL